MVINKRNLYINVELVFGNTKIIIEKYRLRGRKS